MSTVTLVLEKTSFSSSFVSKTRRRISASFSPVNISSSLKVPSPISLLIFTKFMLGNFIFFQTLCFHVCYYHQEDEKPGQEHYFACYTMKRCKLVYISRKL